MRPNGGGVYGLSNAQGWIYINTAENIQAALLNHLSELNRVSSFQTATGFTFELCDTDQRAERRDQLIVELHPVLNESSKRNDTLALAVQLRESKEHLPNQLNKTTKVK